MLNRLLGYFGYNVTFNEFIEASRIGGDTNLETVQLFIEQNRNYIANINATDRYGNTALIYAAEGGYTSIVTALLATPGIDINYTALTGNTALIRAAYNGHDPIVTALLARITNAYDLKREKIGNRLVRSAAMEAESYHPAISARIVARITELERLQNNVEEKNTNPPAPIAAPKRNFKEQLKDCHDGDFPPRLCCPISLDLMEDPITPSCAITFDRQSLIRWFAERGNPAEVPCPVTRKPIKISELNISSTVFVLDLLQELVDTSKEKHAHKNLNEGIAPIQEEKNERPALTPKSPLSVSFFTNTAAPTSPASSPAPRKNSK